MTASTPFLVFIGDLPEKSMEHISKLLSQKWGGGLSRISSEEAPNKTIPALASDSGLVEIFGDVAMMHSSGVSWMEALGAWKVPTILIVSIAKSSVIPGIAYSYVALCKQLSVPLVGIVQLGEPWLPYERRMDGLPWCGYIPNDLLQNKKSINPNDCEILGTLIDKLKIQYKYIND